MNKKELSERDICTKFITPALRQAGWDELTQLREEVSFTKGRIIVRGKMVTRGKAKRADYILYYQPNIPLAVIEAKDNHSSVGDGMQQALGYADTLQLPFVFSSNGDGFVFHDRTATTSDSADDSLPATLGSTHWKGSAEPSLVLRTTTATAATRDRATTRPARLTPRRGGREGAGPAATRHGDGHRQDVHRLPDHLAPVENRPEEACPVPCRPQRAGRPDDGERLQAVLAPRWRS